MKALSELRNVSQRLNYILELLDPAAASQYEKLQATATTDLEYLQAIKSLDPSYWQGRMILFNLQAPPHLDKRNPPAEWTPLHAAGSFVAGGSLFLHDLNLRLRYLPGDLIFIRGRLLEHSVEPWQGGQRISAVYFTHEDMWKYYKLRLSM